MSNNQVNIFSSDCLVYVHILMLLLTFVSSLFYFFASELYIFYILLVAYKLFKHNNNNWSFIVVESMLFMYLFIIY